MGYGLGVFQGFVVGICTLNLVNVAAQLNYGPAGKIVPCKPQQARQAQVRGGGTQSFTLPNGKKVDVTAPDGWCVQ
jgi:hypothetical protein